MPPLILLLFLAGTISVYGQEDFYHPGTIREIRISFAEPNWRHLLDSLFEHTGDDGKLTGDVTIDGHTCPKSGIRYKGYSSYNANEIKNPFNIDLDYSFTNQNHLGYVKIKLSNVIHDPSFLREVLSYEIARKYMPASGANFARLYINDTLIGLYTNVEAVNETFTNKYWGNDRNSFFKGEPLKLQYPFGQNANLAITHGTDSSGYIPFYNMESATGWNDLYDLIYRLDQGAASAEVALNTDRALWMHAFNEVLCNLDSYIGYAQNYYLFRDDNGRFNPIPWDLNMSFGSFRDSDGSRNFLGITIPEVKQLDPLALMDFTVSPRPLMTRLFSDDTLRKIYFAHMRTLVDENFRNGWYMERGSALQALIDADVRRDTNRFYSYEDFHANLTVTVGGSGSMKQYPGLADLMEARMDYLDSLAGFSGQPVISGVGHQPVTPAMNEICFITARIMNATMAYLGCRFNSAGIFSRISMADDGNHGDGEANDGVYGAGITISGHTVQFYIYAENEAAATLSPERAEYEFHSFQPEIAEGDLVINEFRAGTGDSGWIEVFNTTAEPLNVAGMLITYDAMMSGGYPLPDTAVPARRYLVIHPALPPAGGKEAFISSLSAEGGHLGLYNAGGRLIDALTYGLQPMAQSTGRYPNGYGPFTFMQPSKGSYNATRTTPESGFILYPNPAAAFVGIAMQNPGESVALTIYDMKGAPVAENNDLYQSVQPGPVFKQVDVSHLRTGLYMVRIKCNGVSALRKMMIY